MFLCIGFMWLQIYSNPKPKLLNLHGSFLYANPWIYSNPQPKTHMSLIWEFPKIGDLI